MSRYIHHVTLTTGHTRKSWRHEVDPGLMQMLAAVLDAALADGALLPDGSVLRAEASGRCLLATVTHDDVPLLTMGVAEHSRCGRGLWRALHEQGQPELLQALATRGQDWPGEPWCAARLEGGLLLYPDAAGWLGDMERCLAWAWLDRVEARRA